MITILLLATCAWAEPIQWTLSDGGNGHFYEAVSTPLTWQEAQDYAYGRYWAGMRGHLVTLTSQEEQDWVWENLDSLHQFYLGGYQEPGSIEPGGGWRWVTNEPWEFSNWSPNEPNNSNGGEELLEFSGGHDGFWNDIPDWGQAQCFIVEYDQYESVPMENVAWGSLKRVYR